MASLRSLAHDRRGGYSIVAALVLPVVVGFAGLGTETGLWFYTHQSMQSAADTAAYSAALAYTKGNATYESEARAVAASYGYVQGVNGATVSVNRPPASGPNAANSNAIEVQIRQPQQRLFSAVFSEGTLNIGARAVATMTPPAGVACVLGLDPTAANTVQLLNNAILPDPTCGVASNSSAATALALSNNAAIYGPTNSHGGTSLAINSHLYGNPNLSNAAPIPDPYANSSPGTPPACTTQNGAGSNNGNRALRPDTFVGGVGMAHFCAGLNFTNNFTVTFEPGIYFIDSQMVFGNNASITGTDVTLVINGNYAISIGNNARVTLNAPTTGPTAGIAFFGSRTGTPTVVQRFANNTVLNITGGIYFPNQILEMDNNTSTLPNHGCTQVIGRMVRFMNNVDLGANCAGAGITQMAMGPSSTQLVE